MSIFRIVRLKYVFLKFFVLRKQGPENITFPVFSWKSINETIEEIKITLEIEL